MSQVAQIRSHELVTQLNTLRSHGLTDEQIADALSLSVSVVRSVPLPQPHPQRQRSVQHMQIQSMQTAFAPKAAAGDHDAAATLLKVMKREADLLGLDAPKEVITHNFDHDKELENLSTAELKRRALEAIERGAIVEGELVAEDTSPQAPDTARQGDQTLVQPDVSPETSGP